MALLSCRRITVTLPVPRSVWLWLSSRAGAAPRPADPVILLSGGPGEKTVASAVSLAIGYASLYGERDFIIFNQHGAGLSRPSLQGLRSTSR